MIFTSSPFSLFWCVSFTLRNAVDYSRISAGDIIWRNKDPALDSRLKAYMDKGDTQVRVSHADIHICIHAYAHKCTHKHTCRKTLCLSLSLSLSLFLFLSPSLCLSVSLSHSLSLTHNPSLSAFLILLLSHLSLRSFHLPLHPFYSVTSLLSLFAISSL